MSDAIIVRLAKLHEKMAPHVQVKFATEISSSEEVDGQEQHTGSAYLVSGALDVSFTPYQPRTFALHLGSPAPRVHRAASQAVVLPYGLAASSEDTKSNGGLDSRRRCITG